MDLFPVYGTNFKLDGGAAFGVVPKVLWEMFYRPDTNNLINPGFVGAFYNLVSIKRVIRFMNMAMRINQHSLRL